MLVKLTSLKLMDSGMSLGAAGKDSSKLLLTDYYNNFYLMSMYLSLSLPCIVDPRPLMAFTVMV